MPIRSAPLPRPAARAMARATARATALAIAAAALLIGAPAAAQTACAGGYTIRTGDTLVDIASRCGITVPALLSANPGVADDQDLAAGGRLRMPAPGMRPSPVEACGGFYTLRPGDTLSEVAEKCGLTVPLLVAANPALEDPDNVVAGGRVRIPDLPRPGTAGRPVVGPRIQAAATGVAAIGAGSAAADSLAPAAADSTAAAAAADSAAAVPFLRYEGVLGEGDPCPVLRLADGTRVGLVGEPGRGFEVGDRVVVTGPDAPDATCGTERAVQLRILWRREGR